MGDRDRSRSPRGATGEVIKPMPWDAKKEAELEPVKTPEDLAMDQLQVPIRERLLVLFKEGTLRRGDLDVKSIMALQMLQEPLQIKVMEHMENDRVFLANARSKSGFLIAATDKAKRGELDVRGFGAIDPWKATLEALKCPVWSRSKYIVLNLLKEEEWIEANGGEAAMRKLTVDVSAAPEKAAPSIEVEVSLNATIDEIKERVVAAGVFIPKSKMKLSAPKVGFLRAVRTVGFYNLAEGTGLKLALKTRGGVTRKIDPKTLSYSGGK